MASRRTSRARDDDRDDDRRPGRRRAQQNSSAPIIAFVAIAAVGIVAAGYVFSKKDSNAAPRLVGEDGGAPTTNEEAVDPFEGHVPKPPPKSGYTKLTDNAPPGLAETPIYVQALGIAANAKKEAEAASAALKKGDNDVYMQRGGQALELYNQAIELVADWELELQQKYGDNDKQLKPITREISKWYEGLKKYRKTK